MISMAPSSFTMGDSGPAATRATAATMGPKRSSMACTSSMGDGGAGEAVGFDGGAGFRFTLRLSHARIVAHGLQALVGQGAPTPGSGKSTSLARRGCARPPEARKSLLALAPASGAELEGLHLDPEPALGTRRGEANFERGRGPRIDGALHVAAPPAHHPAVLVEPFRFDDDALAGLVGGVPYLALDEDARGALALRLEGEDQIARGLRREGVGLSEGRERPQSGQEHRGQEAGDHSYLKASMGLSCAALRAG